MLSGSSIALQFGRRGTLSVSRFGNNAISTNADVYVTSDLKYHDFFKANKKILLTDIGHYESEQYTKNAIHTHLTEKITNFAIVLVETNSNPVKYS